jgi:hypothetical protein
VQRVRVAFVSFIASAAPLAAWCGSAYAAESDPHPGPSAAQVGRWIAEDAAALRHAPRGSRDRVIHYGGLLNWLWIAGRDVELRRELARVDELFAGASEPRADPPFFSGDRSAAFAVYAGEDMRTTIALARAARWNEVVRRLRKASASSEHPDRVIAIALLEGDAYAACRHWYDARKTWYRAFSTAVWTRSQMRRFFPEWTSAMRRLVRYRVASGQPSAASGCRGLPAPIIDPIE